MTSKHIFYTSESNPEAAFCWFQFMLKFKGYPSFCCHPKALERFTLMTFFFFFFLKRLLKPFLDFFQGCNKVCGTEINSPCFIVYFALLHVRRISLSLRCVFSVYSYLFLRFYSPVFRRMLKFLYSILVLHYFTQILLRSYLKYCL